MKKNTFGDYLIIGEIAIIGLAEISHLTGVFLKRSFADCAMLLAILLCALLITGVGFLAVWWKDIFAESAGEPRVSGTEKLLYAMFALIVISQLIFIGMGNAIYRKGDMTVETVESFLTCDRIYQVNPMTGMPYTEGMPSRLKILCLPTLYGSLCKWTGLPPALVVQKIVPMAVLLGSYLSFSLLGRTLFAEDGRKRACFLLLVSLLLWVGSYRYGIEGFDLLCCGWRGVAVRGGVLLPWLVSLCLRRKWFGILLCAAAEGCIVWTLYGCGVCLAVAAGMTAARIICRRIPGMADRGMTACAEEKGDVK